MSKRILLASLGLFVLCAGINSAGAAPRTSRALASVCSNKVGISGYIYKNYQPLRRGPNDHTLVGYQRNPTLLDNGGGSRRGSGVIYDGNGKRLAVCQGLPCDECRNHWRFKCSTATASIRRAAVAAKRSATIYFGVGGGKCVTVTDAGKCYGSVKGLCNQTLK
jgi:hypothetical protein